MGRVVAETLSRLLGVCALAVFGRTTLLSLRVYEGATIQSCTHHCDAIKYARFPVTRGFPARALALQPCVKSSS